MRDYSKSASLRIRRSACAQPEEAHSLSLTEKISRLLTSRRSACLSEHLQAFDCARLSSVC